MRNHWRRLLLLRCSCRPRPLVSASTPLGSQVQSVRSISSSLIPGRAPPFMFDRIQSPIVRFYSSSEVAAEPPKDSSDGNEIAVALTNIFTHANLSAETINQGLESNNILVTHDLVLNALESLQSAPVVARRFFNWVSRNEEQRLSSKSYNLMLCVLLENGYSREFWEMVGVMRGKGFGVSKATFRKAMDKFEEKGLRDDVEKLNKLYASGSTDNSVENLSFRVCRVIRQDVWGVDLEKWLRDLNVEFSSELVSMVVENVGFEGNKGLLFFRWLEESGLFKHDEQTYGALLRVLASEGSSDKFWRAFMDMRTAGLEMDTDTYVYSSDRFVKKLMITDAVDLYDFAMRGLNKPSVHDCTFLLKKIAVGKELDIDLFSRVLRVFKDSGNAIGNSMFDAVLKSLTSAGRLERCNDILKAMKEAGFVAKWTSQSRVAFQLSKAGKHEAASEFMHFLEGDDCGPNDRIWSSLVEGYCLAGDLEKASVSFREAVKKVQPSTAGHVLEVLVNAYCHKSRAADVCGLVSEMIVEKELPLRHSTYRILISMLLDQGGFKQALDVLPLMKNQGYPPILKPFIDYIAKSGSVNDAVAFLTAMTVKRIPSRAVFIQLFEAYFEAGRTSEAQDLLSRSPVYIKNHADVLNLFLCQKAGDLETPAVLTAS
ncbi:OLC1v1009896C1 [Oldenlandia corymbosa var. corymbosa]|uniref:OLC1v1009896C1 n=1 Tax=Oldenlandia corymbosa var. corymbosa TaxID=529605 RepID=A0AAV1DT67_OLDCO|nr:OLC1v1009896C1 [Oldenlandia corymbosa var. corymbosa]